MSDKHIFGILGFLFCVAFSIPFLPSSLFTTNVSDTKVAERNTDRPKLIIRENIKEFSVPTLESNPTRQDKFAQWISDTYDIAYDKSVQIVKSSFEHGKASGIDPVMILAIIYTESRFIETVSGRNGQGLMQIVPKWHAERIKTLDVAKEAIRDIDTNIRLGTSIYKDFLIMAKQDVQKALLLYNGSINDPSKRYSRKVLEMFKIFNKTIPDEPVHKFEKKEIVEPPFGF